MDFMIAKRYFFQHVIKSKLTGEQLRVLICMLTTEADGVIGIKQNEIAEMLSIAEPNVSRSIKALTEAGLLSKKETKGQDGQPIWLIDPIFEKQAIQHTDAMYEKVHGKPFKPTW
jgi:predicted transcriptional regulator